MTATVADLGRILFEPGTVFTRLKARPSAWLPLAAILLAQCAVLWWWGATVDYAWLRAHVAGAAGDMPPEARALLAQSVAPGPMQAINMASVLLGIPLAYTLLALYYRLAGRVLKSGIPFAQWFAFVCWTSVPALLVTPLMAVQVVLSQGRVAQDQLNIASLAALLGLAPQSPWFGMLNLVDFSFVWGIVLAAIGLRAWTGCTARAGAITAVLPFAVVLGTWALWIILFS